MTAKAGAGWVIPPAYLQDFMRPDSEHLWAALASGLSFQFLTPEQQAASRASREIAAVARRAEVETEHAEALAAAPAALRPFLEHHRPHVDAWSDFPYCEGCDGGGGV